MAKNLCCVGGITMDGRYVRLLDKYGQNQPEDTDFTPRQIWSIDFAEKKSTIAPHIEDVLVTRAVLYDELKKKVKIRAFIEDKKIPIWRGSPDRLFDGLINWSDAGSGYIARSTGIPPHSVGFWICDKDLTRKIFKGDRYEYPRTKGWRSIKYKGFDDPVEVIPTGTLIRISLARWKSFAEKEEEKCWLQLSGWYDL